MCQIQRISDRWCSMVQYVATLSVYSHYYNSFIYTRERLSGVRVQEHCGGAQTPSCEQGQGSRHPYPVVVCNTIICARATRGDPQHTRAIQHHTYLTCTYTLHTRFLYMGMGMRLHDVTPQRLKRGNVLTIFVAMC